MFNNEMKLEFISKSSNEAFARLTVAAFASQLDPTIEELADIMEVIQSIMRVKNISYEELKNVQQMKREKKGGFSNKIYLVEVEQDKADEREEQEMKKEWRKNDLDER